MDNYQIADIFSLLAKLMDIHGENSFKAKSYSSAAFAIEKCEVQLIDLPVEKISSIKGLGSSASQKIAEIIETGQLKVLEEIIFKTPPGVIEMINIKGIGPKKINTIWKEMEIESVGELLYACKENRLKLYKGFGEKTQQSINDTIEFYLKSKESHLYFQVELAVEQTLQLLQKIFGENSVVITGEFKRQLEIINHLDFIINQEQQFIEEKLIAVPSFQLEEKTDTFLRYKSSSGIRIKLHPAETKRRALQLIKTSSSGEFMDALLVKCSGANLDGLEEEKEVFSTAGTPYFPARLRELAEILDKKEAEIPDPIQVRDIKGIIHCHSNWSDGSNSIEELALAARERGLEYLVISDHSKSAFYANGLREERIQAQHQYINELNTKLAPFKVFKSIESDILNDGSLDYSNEILSTFDLVIASVHSNLKMTEDKAMARLITAIENPYTTILGHMTGRLLLSRNGYPVDHKKIIDACAANYVVVELNAHPNRLDIDWRHIQYALDKNVMISIDPDAHFIEGLDDIRFGVTVAQKTLLTKENNLSSLGRENFEKYILHRRSIKNL